MHHTDWEMLPPTLPEGITAGLAWNKDKKGNRRKMTFSQETISCQAIPGQNFKKVIPAEIFPHFLFSSLSSDPSFDPSPIYPIYLHFICYQLYKFCVSCVHLETRSMSFSSVAESLAQHLTENLLGGAGRAFEISE